jgi:hypothetical protein
LFSDERGLHVLRPFVCSAGKNDEGGLAVCSCHECCRGPPLFSLFETCRNLHYPASPSDCMQDIISSKKMENGIVVFWDEKGEKKNESFNYSELIDMKINALDLLDRPKSYKVDKEAHKLIVKK